MIVGLFIAALAYLEYQRIVSVDWNRIQVVSQNGFVWATNTIAHISNTIGTSHSIYHIGIPLASSLQFHFVFAYNDPIHCQGYNACYTIGYRDGYNDAQNGISPAYACFGHSENWCSGYNDGFRAGDGGSNIFYGQRSDQTANINVRGDNNKIIVNQQSDNQMGFTLGHKSSDGALSNCVIFWLNSDIRIK